MNLTESGYQRWMNEWIMLARGGIYLFCWHGLSPPVQTSFDCSPLSFDETFLSWWVWSLWGCPHPYPQGMMVHWMVWWVWKLCKSFAMVFTVTRSQPSWAPNEKLWNNVLESALKHHYQNTYWGNIFGKNDIHLSSTVLEIYGINAKEHVLMSRIGLTMTLYFKFILPFLYSIFIMLEHFCICIACTKPFLVGNISVLL